MMVRKALWELMLIRKGLNTAGPLVGWSSYEARVRLGIPTPSAVHALTAEKPLMLGYKGDDQADVRHSLPLNSVPNNSYIS